MTNTFEDPESGPKIWRRRSLGVESVRRIGRQAIALIGLLLVILSIPLGFLTPFIPIGLPMGIFGAALLARNSVWGQRLILGLINRYPRLRTLTAGLADENHPWASKP